MSMAAGDQDYAYCAELLADGDRDRWLASLFIPQAQRPHVQALHAFAHEIERIPTLVSDPRIGEIRLQWWREVLEGERSGEAAQNPAAHALVTTMRACSLPAQPLIDLIEAHRFDLYADPMPTMNDLEGWCGETASSLFRLAALVLGGNPEAGLADACGHAGVAFALARLLSSLPQQARRHQCFIPRDILDAQGISAANLWTGQSSPGLSKAISALVNAARDHFAKARANVKLLPRALAPAFVPLAVVPLYLNAVERAPDPLAHAVEVAQWRRQWAMWRW